MVAEGGGKDAAPRTCDSHRQLVRSIEGMADELPVHKVMGVIDGNIGRVMSGLGSCVMTNFVKRTRVNCHCINSKMAITCVGRYLANTQTDSPQPSTLHGAAIEARLGSWCSRRNRGYGTPTLRCSRCPFYALVKIGRILGGYLALCL